jgi:hypothetical protein
LPTLFVIDGQRFFFFSNEGTEPMHVHVEKAEKYAKFWLHPVSVAYNYRFNSAELNRLVKLVEARKDEIEDKWNDYFGNA